MLRLFLFFWTYQVPSSFSFSFAFSFLTHFVYPTIRHHHVILLRTRHRFVIAYLAYVTFIIASSFAYLAYDDSSLFLSYKYLYFVTLRP